MVDYAPPSFQFPPGRVSGPTTLSIRQTPRTSIYGTPISPPHTYHPQHLHHASPSSPVAYSPTRISRSSSTATYAEPYVTPSYTRSAHTPGAYPPSRRPTSTSTSTSSSTSSRRPSADNTMMIPRRSDSTNTTTTSSTMLPAPSAYVANLRRQRATVWSERAQEEDAALLKQQQMAKRKAAMEVMGSSAAIKLGPHGLGSGSSTSSSMRNRLGKHSQPVFGIGTGSLVGDLPPRLSASEANDDSDDEEQLYMSNHRRSGSGRSSLSSSHRRAANRTSTMTGDYRSSSYGTLRRDNSKGSSTRSYSPKRSLTELTEAPVLPRGKSRSPQLVSPHILEERTPDVRGVEGGCYFASGPSPTGQTEQGGSGGQGQGQRGNGIQKPDLQRRGSVDEGAARTMTMTGLRLVVANPD